MPDADPCLNTASIIVLHPSAAELLCVRHPSVGKWMFPGGKVEQGEPPHRAALREVCEETGLAITLSELCDLPRWAQDGNLRLPQPFAVMQERLPDHSATYIDFIFVGVSDMAVLTLDREITEAGWFDPSTLASLDTSFPIRQLADYVIARQCEIRAAARPDIARLPPSQRL